MQMEERVGQAITETQAVEFAGELYGLTVTAKSLPGEYDDNFHLTKTDNSAAGMATRVSRNATSFVLKVMHPARERTFIELQCRTLQHLAERAPQVLLPRVCATRSGEIF